MPIVEPGLVRCASTASGKRSLVLPPRTRCRYLGQSEVQNLGVAAFGDKDVGGLDVAVHDALGVGGIKSVSDLDGQRKQRLQFQRPNPDQVLQRLPVQKLHSDERPAALLPDLINRADVGVIQGRGSLGFPLETRQSLRVFADFVRQEFEGNKTMESGVLSLVDHSHPTTAELLDNAVVRNGLADHCARILRGPSGQVNESREAGRLRWMAGVKSRLHSLAQL